MTKRSNKPRKSGSDAEQESVRGMSSAPRSDHPPAELQVSNRATFADMAPGEIVFLDDFAHLRGAFSAQFVAVLACPWCGSPGLITSAQYAGGAPIVCTSKVCSGSFRIVDEAQVVPLRPS